MAGFQVTTHGRFSSDRRGLRSMKLERGLSQKYLSYLNVSGKMKLCSTRLWPRPTPELGMRRKYTLDRLLNPFPNSSFCKYTFRLPISRPCWPCSGRALRTSFNAFVEFVWLFAHEPFHLLTYSHTFKRILVSNAAGKQ